jgi:antitoxin component YwqK of YwqJK toxin-antitoxin module
MIIKVIFLPVLSLFFSLSCYSQCSVEGGNYTDSLGRKQGKWCDFCVQVGNKKWTNDEGIYYNNQRTGYWHHYLNNKILTEGQYQNDSLNGVVTTYYTNDAIRSILPFQNGKINGRTYFFNKRGKCVAKVEYCNSVITEVIFLHKSMRNFQKNEKTYTSPQFCR